MKATDFWANAAKEIVATTGVLDKGTVLDKGVLDTDTPEPFSVTESYTGSDYFDEQGNYWFSYEDGAGQIYIAEQSTIQKAIREQGFDPDTLVYGRAGGFGSQVSAWQELLASKKFIQTINQRRTKIGSFPFPVSNSSDIQISNNQALAKVLRYYIEEIFNIFDINIGVLGSEHSRTQEYMSVAPYNAIKVSGNYTLYEGTRLCIHVETYSQAALHKVNSLVSHRSVMLNVLSHEIYHYRVDNKPNRDGSVYVRDLSGIAHLDAFYHNINHISWNDTPKEYKKYTYAQTKYIIETGYSDPNAQSSELDKLNKIFGKWIKL